MPNLRGKEKDSAKITWGKRLVVLIGIIVTAALLSTGGVLLDTYRNVVTESVVPAFKSTWNHLYGIFSPLPEARQYNFSLTFYKPLLGDKSVSSETTGVSVSGKECLKAGGTTVSEPSSHSVEDWRNNVITEVYCSRSRVIVTLIPQHGGNKQTLYDGFFHNGEKIPFPAVNGRYHAGVLNMMSTETNLRSGD